MQICDRVALPRSLIPATVPRFLQPQCLHLQSWHQNEHGGVRTSIEPLDLAVSISLLSQICVNWNWEKQRFQFLGHPGHQHNAEKMPAAYPFNASSSFFFHDISPTAEMPSLKQENSPNFAEKENCADPEVSQT